jgi:hypothetical protein
MKKEIKKKKLNKLSKKELSEKIYTLKQKHDDSLYLKHLKDLLETSSNRGV